MQWRRKNKIKKKESTFLKIGVKNIKTMIEDIQIIPPWKDDKRFEDFVEDYFNELDSTTSYSIFGRNGQEQYGIDIYSFEKTTVIQCKLRLIENQTKAQIKKELIKELNKDFNSFLKFNKKHQEVFVKFIFASTFLEDADIEEECIKLSINHPKISIEYWNWRKLLRRIPQPILDKYYRDFIKNISEYYLESEQNLELKPFTINYNIDNSLHIVDRIYNYFQYLYKELGYVPISFLKSNYPFKTSDSYFPYYSVFALSTDNKDLIDLLEALKISEGSVKIIKKDFFVGTNNPLKKIKEILIILSNNLVFHVCHEKSRQNIFIRTIDFKTCNCIVCLYDELKYQELLIKLNSQPVGITETLKYAYIHYQMGYYVESAKYYSKAGMLAKKSKKLLLYATIQYSLSKLYNHINNNYWGDNRNEELLKKLQSININRVLQETHRKNSEFVSWVFNTFFFTSKSEQITDLVSKIRDNYHSQLNGGNSSNSHVWELINSYAELDSFLNLNRIVYNRFFEYSKLTEQFIEGLFLSHAIKSENSSKLEEFDDWSMQKMLMHGNTDYIKKYFYRYKLTELKYKSYSREESTFITIVSNFLDGQKIFISQFEKCENASYRFWDQYLKIFNNILVILALSDISKDETKRLARKIYDFIIHSNTLKSGFIDNLRLFISRKGKILDSKILTDFLSLYDYNEFYHNSLFIKTLVYHLSNKDDVFYLNAKLQDALINDELVECKKCKSKHYYTLLPDLYSKISDNTFKLKVKDAIEIKLDSSFDHDLYYNSAMNDVIDYKKYYHNYIRSVIQKIENISDKSGSSKEIKRNNFLNELLNLCYKNEIDLKSKEFNQFKGINDYYDWLLNLKDFEYNKFVPMWGTEYPTIYYYNEFAKHPIIKKSIENSLKIEKNQKLSDLYIEISMSESSLKV